MAVRAKFYCSSKRETISMPTTDQSLLDSNKAVIITLHPVTNGSEENKQFYKYTPCGQIELSTLNAKAAEQFEIGKSYYIDFTLAE